MISITNIINIRIVMLFRYVYHQNLITASLSTSDVYLILWEQEGQWRKGEQRRLHPPIVHTQSARILN